MKYILTELEEGHLEVVLFIIEAESPDEIRKELAAHREPYASALAARDAAFNKYGAKHPVYMAAQSALADIYTAEAMYRGRMFSIYYFDSYWYTIHTLDEWLDKHTLKG
jgi:hypothetical protein